MKSIAKHDLPVFADLLLELGTELDLHYDDDDLFALEPSFRILKEGVRVLEEVGQPINPDVFKIISRFDRNR